MSRSPLRLGAALALSLWVSGLAVAQSHPGGEGPQVTRAPELQVFVEAEYPADKKAAGITAQVLLSLDIDENGRVTAARVVESGGPDFDAAAVAAAQKFVFRPGEVDRQPAPVTLTYRYKFTIRTEMVKLGPQINFEGTVRERFSKRAMPGIKVNLKDLGVSTTTDAEGQFAFVDVPLGKHQVELSGDKLVTQSTEETLEKDLKKTVKYLVEEKQEGIDEERVTRAPRIKKEAAQTTIRSEEARRVPGTQGDAIKVVQNLPGVARAAFGSGALVVWGASPKETKTNLDGVEIPALYHFGGFRATVNSELVRSIELVPGAYGADFGRGLGGLVKIETRPLPDKGFHGYVAADVIDASAMLTGAIGDRFRIGIAGRASYLDRVVRGLTSKDVGELVPLPRYYDYQLVSSLKLRRDEDLSLLFLASSDRLERTVPSEDPSNVRKETTESTFYRLILRYQRLDADGSSLAVTPSFGWEGTRSTTRFGEVPTNLDQQSYRYGLRASYRRKVARPLTLSVGLDLQGSATRIDRFGSINLPPREGDVTVFGQPPGDDINADRFRVHSLDVGPFVFGELQLGKVTITPGFRLDAFVLDGTRIAPAVGDLPPVGFTRVLFGASPRLQISYKPHKRVTLTVATGLYYQPPDPDELSSVFGNPRLGLQRAVHVTAGIAARLTGTLALEATAYYKHLDHLIMRNALPTPPLAEALVQDGVGRSYGAQILLRQELWKGFFGWITYSVSRSERRNHPGSAWRLFDYDQTHVLTLIASYEYKGWVFGTRLRYATGMPRTRVTGALYDVRSDRYQPVFGNQNTLRIPDFVQLDVRIEKTWTRKRVQINAYLDVQNVTAHANPEEILYNFDYAKRDYIKGLPILAVFGLKVTW